MSDECDDSPTNKIPKHSKGADVLVSVAVHLPSVGDQWCLCVDSRQDELIPGGVAHCFDGFVYRYQDIDWLGKTSLTFQQSEDQYKKASADDQVEPQKELKKDLLTIAMCPKDG